MIDKLTLENDLSKCNKRLRISPFDPRIYIYRGMIYFKLGRLLESLQDFNKAEELNPQLTPYLWQRGISYYYLGKYAKGARQFELDLSVNSQDVEETLWHYLCIAQLENFFCRQENVYCQSGMIYLSLCVRYIDCLRGNLL
jgi:tetratricopeptide (TPR) repeat protein